MTPSSHATRAEDPRPQPPRAPEQWECCHSGCDPCVYDLYWSALEAYEQALREWEKRQPSPAPE